MLGRAIARLKVSVRRHGLLSLKKILGLLLLALCMLLAVSPLPFSLTFRLMHSMSTLRNTASVINAQRTQAALDFLSLVPRKTREELRAMSRPDDVSYMFTIAIITVGRKKPPHTPQNATGLGYLLQSAASVMALMRRKESILKNSFVFVCNVDQHPDNHDDAVRLQDFLPYAQRYGSSTIPNVSDLVIPGTEKLYKSTRHATMYDSELHDYNFCLQVAQRYKSQYYLILQDDTIPCPEFSDVLEHTLLKLNKQGTCLKTSSSSRSSSSIISSSNSNTDSSSSSKSSSDSISSRTPVFSHLVPSYHATCSIDDPPYSSGLTPQTERTISPTPNSTFSFIKFYFPERWQGFAYEPLRILELLSVCAVGGGLGLIFHGVWVTCKRKQPFQPGWRAFVMGIVVSLLIAYLAGRQNLNELRRVSKYLYRLQPSPRCCVPAMLYPAPVMPFLITWLAESPEYRSDRPDENLVDLRIYDCFQHYQVPGYYVEPNLVHHIGNQSSLPKPNKKPVEEFLMSCW